MDKVIERLINLAVDAAGNIIFSILLIVVGFKLTKFIINIIKKGKGFNKLEKSVQTFIVSFLSILFKVIVLISAASILGIPMTSMITIIGSAGLALGLALQGGLSNIAGSLMILIFKPFKVGDYVDTHADSGTVTEITMFHTVLTTLDNKKVVIPNGNLSNSVVVNYTAMKTRRVDLKFSVSYNSDIDKVKEILYNAANQNNLILKDPDIFVGLSEHADSALIFDLKAWTNKDNYLNAKYTLNESVKKEFDKNKIEIPYPQLDVHVDK